MYKRKNWLKTSFYFFYVVILLISCTTSKKVIKQTQAFSETFYPGIVAVDENGKEKPSNSQTKYFVYAVTTSDKIKWDTAWINGKVYTISAEKMKEPSFVEVGIDKLTGHKISITIRKGEYLYLLQLKPISNTTGTQTIPAKELRIKASYKTKEMNLMLSDIKELVTPDPV